MIEDDLFEIALNETRTEDEDLHVFCSGKEFPEKVIVRIGDEKGKGHRKNYYPWEFFEE